MPKDVMENVLIYVSMPYVLLTTLRFFEVYVDKRQFTVYMENYLVALLPFFICLTNLFTFAILLETWPYKTTYLTH